VWALGEWACVTRNEFECGKERKFRENSESLEAGMRKMIREIHFSMIQDIYSVLFTLCIYSTFTIC